jgi:hypothetical protein
MRTIELVLAALVILGCVFKIQHWPGAAILYISSGCGLALFYFPFGFRTLAAPKPTDQILWMTLFGGLSMSTALSGEIAFLQRWPYSAGLMVAGAIACAVALMVGFVLRYRQPRLDIYLDGLLVRCLVLGGLAFILRELFAGEPH